MGNEARRKIAARPVDGLRASQAVGAGETMALPKNEVHVWIVSLDVPDASVGALAARLDADERTRAARFRFEKDRRAYTVARSTLRTLLGGYLGAPAESLAFAYGAHGKPSLAGSGADRVRFNLSHSDDLGVFAFARSVDVGVDVERMRALADLENLAERFFSIEEVAALRRVSESARPEAFYRCWTAKEAYIKGVGEGLSMPLDRFAVSLVRAEGPVSLRILRGDAPGDAWRLHRFEPRPGYVAALAVAGRSFRIRFGDWHPTESVR